MYFEIHLFFKSTSEPYSSNQGTTKNKKVCLKFFFENLFIFLAGKYCELLEKEGGLELLKEIINHPAPPRSVKELAEIAINNCRQYKQLMVRMKERLEG